MIAREAGLLVLLVALLPALWAETGWRELADAPQTIYRSGVPHTGPTGTPRLHYEPGRSFFPIGIYHALNGSWHGREYDFATLANAGFNTVHVWERQPSTEIVEAAQAAKLHVIFHDPDAATVKRFRDDPTVLSWYLDEEPALRRPESEQAAGRAEFAARRDALRRLDPGRAVHIVAAAPRRFAVWDAWATVGDVAAFSVYPVRQGTALRLAGPRALADTVTRAVVLNHAAKPVWFVAQAFASPTLGWRMPSAREYRTMVYTAIVHGATGVIAFAYDSFVTRDGQVLGIAPAPVADYGDIPDYDGHGDAPLVVDSAALAASRSLWQGVRSVNHELAVLTPALLSPTAALPYTVSVRGLSDAVTPVRTLLKRDDGSYVLIAVNVSGSPLDVRFIFDADIRSVRRPFAPDASPRAIPRGWQTRLAAFETQIFRFAAVPAPAVHPQGPQS